MTAPKRNGSVTYRELVETIQAAADRTAIGMHRLGDKFDAHVANSENRLDSLEQSRAEGKGRAAVIAVIISLLMNVLGAIIIFSLTHQREVSPTPSPTIVVTLAPMSLNTPGQTLLQPIYRTSQQPAGSPQTPPKGTASPSPSPSPSGEPPTVVTVVCNTLPKGLKHRLCAPVPAWIRLLLDA